MGSELFFCFLFFTTYAIKTVFDSSRNHVHRRGARFKFELFAILSYTQVISLLLTYALSPLHAYIST